MFQSALKLAFLLLAVGGPFVAGALHPYVIEPGVYAFFVVAGVLAGVGGLCGFTAIGNGEAVRHERALRGGRP